jgi:single-strand DNA-binding protein
MAGLNKIIIIGNLGRDPEMRYTPSGSPVTNFTVAVSRRYNTRDGEAREETEWFRVSCWDRLAETANQYLQKGRQVYIEGRVKIHSWDDSQSGERRSQMEISASNLVLLGQRGDQPEVGEQAAGVDAAELDNMPF